MSFLVEFCRISVIAREDLAKGTKMLIQNGTVIPFEFVNNTEYRLGWDFVGPKYVKTALKKDRVYEKVGSRVSLVFIMKTFVTR